MSKGGLGNKSKRAKGQFYTPTLFVDYAHQMISNQFGEDWKEKFVVWDNCCGTKNLTRDYYFNELYCSTLENAELTISERYNKEATSFQFDFLNDSLDKLPQGLKDALEQNKPIIFFINPPYAKNTGENNTGTKESVCFTKVREEMNADKMDACSANLYAQFLYRIIKIKEQYNLTDVHIALFCKPNYLSGDAYKNFRKTFFDNFSYRCGILFNASEFSEVSDKWGINFTIWNSGKQTEKNNFTHTLIENNNGEIIAKGSKNIYNLDGTETASVWVRKETKGLKTYDVVNLTSGIKVREKDGARKGMMCENSLGYFYNAGNNVYKNAQQASLFTSACSNGIGVSIIPENLSNVVALFSARKLIVGNWINDKDEYLAPNEENEHYNEFVNDSIVYSLFHSASNQSSLRNIEYKGKNWDIKNEFFFMSKDDIISLANENGFDFTYNDAKVSSDRFVYAKLQGIELSAEAQAVLDKAIELTKMSFKHRELFNDEHPEYQIMNWDCGWYQIKGMLKEYMPNDLKDFNELFKALADKMRPMVYELGFLK